MAIQKKINSLLAQRRRLRKVQTSAEDLLRQQLRNRKLENYKFRRQHQMQIFVVDFYCPQTKLVVEIDGAIHAGQKVSDHERSEVLESPGNRIIRFPNSLVEKNLETVLAEILAACRANNG